MITIDELICPTCLFCSAPLTFGSEIEEGYPSLVCKECFARLGWPRPIPKLSDQRIRLADKVVYIWDYGRVRDVMHKLKFGNDERVKWLIRELIEKFVRENIQIFTPIDVISFVPMHWFKYLFFRPINLPEWIARVIADILSVQCISMFTTSFLKPTLHRLRRAQERAQAVQEVFRFCPSPQVKRWDNLLLVDDVITTGSTMSELCRMIREVNPGVSLMVFCLCG